MGAEPTQDMFYTVSEKFPFGGKALPSIEHFNLLPGETTSNI